MLRKVPRARYARTDLAASTIDAVGHGSMVGLGETYIPAFALAAGVGEILSGLISTLPMMAGGLLQLVAPKGAHLVRSRRAWVVGMAAGQALSLLFLAMGAWAGHIPAWLLFTFASLYWGTGLATGPAWNTWIDTLVPARLRAGYFARRTRLNQTALMAGIIGGGLALNYSAKSDWLLPTFAVVFGVAAISRAFSAIALASQREPSVPLEHEKPAPLLVTFKELMASPANSLIIFLLVVQASVYISGPFFNAYMLVRIQLSYGEYLVVMAMAYFAKIVALSFLGGIARRIGIWRLFTMASIGIMPLPVFWTFSSNFWYLLTIQMISGTAWAAYELGMFLVLFEAIPATKRTDMLTLFNAGHVTATAAGSMIGVLLMKLSDPVYAYAVVFVASAVGRTLAVICFEAVKRRQANPRPVVAAKPRVPRPIRPAVSLADSVY